MGWVTLSLRKKELKRTHSYYQMRELQIAREERQMSRKYQYEQTVISNDQQEDLRYLRTDYVNQRDGLYSELKAKRESLNSVNASEDTAGDKDQKTGMLNNEIAEIQQKISDAKEDYEAAYNDTQTMWEDELEMIEQEANDVETTYEQEKVDVETQMEAVASEIEAIDSALSDAIKKDTIKLS